MKIMEKYNTQKGLTLVEVLAALVILGIVFVGFMTVFPQMTLFNAKTETKLDTMNLAREEMTKFIESSDGKLIPDQTTKIIPSGQIKPIIELRFPEATTISESHVVNQIPSSTKDDYTSFLFDSKVDSAQEFTFEIQVFDEPDLSGTISLYKTILKILTLEGRVSSETYGYIEVINP